MLRQANDMITKAKPEDTQSLSCILEGRTLFELIRAMCMCTRVSV